MATATYGSIIDLRNAVRDILYVELDRVRPLPRYGVVAGTTGTAVPASAASVSVIPNGETLPVSIQATTIRPMKGTDVVRYSGPPGDRFIDSVVTPSAAQILAERVAGTNVEVIGSTSIKLDTAFGMIQNLSGSGWQFYTTTSGVDTQRLQIHSSGVFVYGSLNFRMVGGVENANNIELTTTGGTITYNSVNNHTFNANANQRFVVNVNGTYAFGRTTWRVNPNGSSNNAYIESIVAGELRLISDSVQLYDTRILVTNLATTTGTANTRYVSAADGRLLWISSWSKGKLDQKVDVEPKDAWTFLDRVPATTWIDKFFNDEHHGMWDYREVGFILEDVLAANADGRRFDTLIDYGPDGKMQGFAYDRYPVAILTPAVIDLKQDSVSHGEMIQELFKRVKTLEGHNDTTEPEGDSGSEGNDQQPDEPSLPKLRF